MDFTFLIYFDSLNAIFAKILCLFDVYCYFHIIIALCVCDMRTTSYTSIQMFVHSILVQAIERWNKVTMYIQIYECVLYNDMRSELEHIVWNWAWTVNNLWHSQNIFVPYLFRIIGGAQVHKPIFFIFWLLLLLSSFHFVQISLMTLFHSMDPYYALNSFEMFKHTDARSFTSLSSLCWTNAYNSNTFSLTFCNAVAGNLFIVRWDTREMQRRNAMIYFYSFYFSTAGTLYSSEFSHQKSNVHFELL